MRKWTRVLSMLLVCCMVFALMPVKAEALRETIEKDLYSDKNVTAEGDIVNDTIVDAKNFFPASGKSTNGHHSVQGLLVDEESVAWVVVATDSLNWALHKVDYVAANTDNGDGTYTTLVEKGKIGTYDENSPHVHAAKASDKKTTSSLTIKFSTGKADVVLSATDNEFAGVQIILLELGPVENLLGLENGFFLEVDALNAGGWDIAHPGMAVNMPLKYAIEKSVDKKDVENVDGQRNLTYIVTVRNTGEETVYGANVYDLIPDGITVNSIKMPDGTIKDVTDDMYKDVTLDGAVYGMLVLETEVTMAPTESRTYEIMAEVDATYMGGTLVNKAYIMDGGLVPKEATADTTVHSYFYVHHIYNNGQGKMDANGNVVPNADPQRIDKVQFNDNLRNGTKFDVTTPGSAGTDYLGMLSGTLYGGTFKNDFTTVYPFADGENGINFTPAVNEHYFVWEPTNQYLRPNHLYVWHSNYYEGHPDKYHTVAGYPLSVVDRDLYQQFGFISQGTTEKSDGTVKQINFYPTPDDPALGDTVTAKEDIGLAGYLGFYEIIGDHPIFGENAHLETPVNAHSEEFIPYWVTMDGVKVTGVRNRTLTYQGLGDASKKNFIKSKVDAPSEVSTYTGRSESPLMVSAMFSTTNIPHPPVQVAPAPDTVGVEYEAITAGNSDNVKGLRLSANLENFSFDDAWFVVNGNRIDTQIDGDNLYAEIDLKEYDEGELTIVPYWQEEGNEPVEGAELVLNVVKKTIEVITPVEEPEEDDSEIDEIEGEIPDTGDEWEDTEEVTDKDAEKAEKAEKKAEKEAEKAEKKAEKEAEKEAKKAQKESDEESVAVTYEEITTVTFVRSAVCFAEANDAQDMGIMGIGLD